MVSDPTIYTNSLSAILWVRQRGYGTRSLSLVAAGDSKCALALDCRGSFEFSVVAPPKKLPVISVNAGAIWLRIIEFRHNTLSD